MTHHPTLYLHVDKIQIVPRGEAQDVAELKDLTREQLQVFHCIANGLFIVEVLRNGRYSIKLIE